MWEDEGASSGNSDLEDSFLRQVARVEMDEPPLRPIPGERLGGPDGRRFRILDDLGQGGMGLVLRAWDEVLLRTVALKFLAPQAGLSQASMLRREARAVARLDHENIVRLLDLSEWRVLPQEEQVPFLVMEYLDGESLSALLRRGPLGLRRALDILGPVAEGLAHAHARQVIHRDLKPGNVFLTRDGRVKLLDFGLARLAAQGTTPTGTLPIAGTPAYMAPEQWRGLPQDARTDIWAAGLLLFEMLTGAPPFRPGSSEELREQILSRAPLPSVRERLPELPEAVEHLLSQALAREPGRRFPSATVLLEHVEALSRSLGARSRAEAGSPQHRQVTLVACRLAGLDSRLGPGDVNELVDAFQKRAQQLLHQYGGGLTLGMGDELVACFGHPVAHEDDAEQAVRAGRELADLLARTRCEQFPHLPDLKLAIRVGIHTDRVVMGSPGAGEWTVTAISGEAPKLAAWLASEAEPGTVLLSQSTQALVQGVFETESLGGRVFAGLGRTVDLGVYRLGRERKALSRFERSRGDGALTPLVGRERELRALEAHWEEARRGRGSFVLVRGDAGIGKSRLIQELGTLAMQGPACCWRAQCWRQSSNSALLPFIELLQRMLELTCMEEPARKRERLEVRLGVLGLPPDDLELLALLLSIPVSEGSPVLGLSPEERKERTREALSRLLARVPERPVFIVLEDVQWADPSTLELLGFLLGQVSTARLLVVMSARTGFSPPWSEGPSFHTLTLERLSAAHTEAMVREVARGGPLPTETVQHLVEKAEGVPLFIEELTRMVLERSPQAGDALAPSIPVTLYELLLARLDQLLPRQKALAQLCAVVGRAVSVSLLARLDTRREEGALEQVLSELVDAGVLQREESRLADGPRYRFRHVLIQDAAYQSLLRTARREHHGRIARVLEREYPEVAEAQPEWLAHHFTGAGEAERAIHYWLRAGESATERSAFVESLGHFRQGLALLDALPDARERIRNEIALRLALVATLMELEGLDASELEQTQERLQELLQQVDADWIPTGMAHWTLFLCVYSLGSIPAAWVLARRLLEGGARQGNDALLGHGHRMRASVLFMRGEFVAAEGALREGVTFFAERGRQCSGTPGIRRPGLIPLSAIHANASSVHSILGQPEQAREHARTALRLADEGGHPFSRVYVRVLLSIAHQLRREAKAGLAWADSAGALAAKHGLVTWFGWAQTLRAWALADLGQPREGLEQLRIFRSSRVWTRVGFRPFLPALGAVHADMLLKLGSYDEGLRVVREGVEWMARADEHFFEAELYRVQGELLRQAGREDEAGSWLHRAVDVARMQRARTLELRAAVSLGRQLQDLGRPDEARALLARATEGLDPGLDLRDYRDARALLLQLSAT
ncbi:protein kinase [Pyxidicoccus fallax]|uniref:Protein kinase n=1 Tax=Pyxidicoccus fallax TaxID=394095 RepID=A0A848LKN1_9BACT|nr:protein kinase [Pyxidicoccus fallax]NMO18337.1 protein kinase [Pyxidicoccus fallax]NPC85089.1 protein kinase [Pyxidicoccus fallax]